MNYKERIDIILNTFEFEQLDDYAFAYIKKSVEEVIPFPCVVIVEYNEDKSGIYLKMMFFDEQDAVAFKLMY